MAPHKIPSDSSADKLVDEAFDRLCNLVTAESMLRLLSPQSLNAVCLAMTALVYAEDNDPDCAVAVTPVETMLHVSQIMNDPIRNAVGSIACALVNMQGAVQRHPRSVKRRMAAALDRVRTKAPAKGKAKARRKSKGRG